MHLFSTGALPWGLSLVILLVCLYLLLTIHHRENLPILPPLHGQQPTGMHQLSVCMLSQHASNALQIDLQW